MECTGKSPASKKSKGKGKKPRTENLSNPKWVIKDTLKHYDEKEEEIDELIKKEGPDAFIGKKAEETKELLKRQRQEMEGLIALNELIGYIIETSYTEPGYDILEIILLIRMERVFEKCVISKQNIAFEDAYQSVDITTLTSVDEYAEHLIKHFKCYRPNWALALPFSRSSDSCHSESDSRRSSTDQSVARGSSVGRTLSEITSITEDSPAGDISRGVSLGPEDLPEDSEGVYSRKSSCSFSGSRKYSKDMSEPSGGSSGSSRKSSASGKPEETDGSPKPEGSG